MKRLFVTGTDTGVGKTFVTCALARRARELGQRVFAFKPVETGCARVGDRLVGEDQEKLVEAAGGWQQGDLRGVYQFEMPAAPLVAAIAEGRSVDLDRIVSVAREGEAQADTTLIEGAGGWRVPVTEDMDMRGLAARLDARIVVVARAGLGTINHSLLTLEAIERDGFNVLALVLSKRPEDGDAFVASNVEQIGKRWPGYVCAFRDGLSLDLLLRSPNSSPV